MTTPDAASRWDWQSPISRLELAVAECAPFWTAVPDSMQQRPRRATLPPVTLAPETPGVAEAAALAHLKATTFAEAFGPDNDPAEVARHLERNFAIDQVAQELCDPDVLTIWIKDQDLPVAYSKVNLAPRESEPDLAGGVELEQIYVRKTHQGLGLGRVLIERACAVARQVHRPFIWLGVWEHNERAINVYRHHGFVVCGSHDFELGNEVQHDLLMRLDVTA